MKTGIYRYFLLLALLSLLFGGCATRQTEPGESAAQKTNVGDPLPGEDWNVQYVEMAAGGGGKLLGFAMTEKGLYISFSRAPEISEEYPLYYLSSQKLGQTETRQIGRASCRERVSA